MVSTEHSVSDASALTGWRKSSYSGGGGGECLEVALSAWFKSSYSGPSNGDCLEVARGCAEVPVRDSKRPTGPALIFPSESWSAFLSAVKRGEFSG